MLCQALCQALGGSTVMDTAPALMELTCSCGLFSPIASYLLLTLVDESHWSVQSAFIHMSFFGRMTRSPLHRW